MTGSSIFKRSAPLLCMCIGSAAVGQAPGSYSLQHPEPGTAPYCLSLEPLGADHYRFTGRSFFQGPPRFYQLDLDASGMVSTGVTIPLDTNTAAYGSAILRTQDGGYLYTSRWLEGSTTPQEFLKTDATGNVEWKRYYPDALGCSFTDVEQGMVEKDGHYFIIGHDPMVPATEGWATVLMELDTTGACVNLRRFAGGDIFTDEPKAFIRTASNGLVTASTNRTYYSLAHYPFILIQSWNASLDVEWSKSYTFGDYHRLNSLNELADGGLVVTGEVRLQNSGPFLPFIFKVDASGELVWSRMIPGARPVLNNILEEPDGTIIMVGWDDAPVIAHADASGELLDSRIAEDYPYNYRPMEVMHDSGGEYLVRTQSMALFKASADLHLWCNDHSYTWADTLVDPVVGNWPMTVTVDAPLTSVGATAPSQPVAFTCTDLCLSTGVQDPGDLPARVHGYPNPADQSMTISFQLPAGATGARLIVRDAIGRVVVDQGVGATGMHMLDTSQLTNGTYVYAISGPTGASTGSKLVVLH